MCEYKLYIILLHVYIFFVIVKNECGSYNATIRAGVDKK